MAQNDFLSFATGPSARVITQAGYAGSDTQLNGFGKGYADETLANKAWRQSSFVVAAIAALAASLNIAMLDNADLPGMQANIATLLQAAGGFQSLTAITSTQMVAIANPNVRGWMIGGGAGGGGCLTTSSSTSAGGGGAGEYVEFLARGLTVGSNILATIGAGGAAGVSSGGGTGGTTSFGAIATAIGGNGGGYANTNPGFTIGAMGGSGGAGGTLHANGFNGLKGLRGVMNGLGWYGGDGASCQFGQGGIGGVDGTGGTSAFGYGAGGAGGSGGGSGFAGSAGLILLAQ